MKRYNVIKLIVYLSFYILTDAANVIVLLKVKSRQWHILHAYFAWLSSVGEYQG